MATSIDVFDGKTIAKVAWGSGSSILFVFTDGSSCCLTPEADYDGDSPEIYVGPICNDFDRVEVGLISRDAFKAKMEAETRQALAADAEREKSEFARLKAKFEPAGDPA